MRALLFLLLMAGTMWAAGCITDATDLVMSEEGTNIVLVLVFTFFLIAAAYMAGTALGNAEYIVFAKDEAYHLGFSMFLLIGFGGAVLLACSVGNAFYSSVFANLGDLPSDCYSESGTMHGVASCYATAVEKDAHRLAESYIKGYIDQLMESTTTYSLALPLMNTYTSSAGSYRRILSNQYDMVANSFIIPALVSVSMQKLMLDLVTDTMVTWILPSAFLLRVFIPTRQMGNVLIALALGLHVLVPFMYVFSFAMYDAVGTEDDCEYFAESVCDNSMDSYDCGSNAEATCKNPDSFWNVARLLPVAFFLPNLTIVMLITFLGAVHKGLRVVG